MKLASSTKKKKQHRVQNRNQKKRNKNYVHTTRIWKHIFFECLWMPRKYNKKIDVYINYCSIFTSNIFIFFVVFFAVPFCYFIRLSTFHVHPNPFKVLLNLLLFRRAELHLNMILMNIMYANQYSTHKDFDTKSC